jgi:TusA-related sulfurtransferase
MKADKGDILVIWHEDDYNKKKIKDFISQNNF